MAQFYTLEEAARVLGMSPEDLKNKAQSREVRAFLDGGTWRFRVVDVDELARRRGMGSDAELRLSDLEVPVADLEAGSAEEFLSEYAVGTAQPDLQAQTIDLTPAGHEDSNADLLVEEIMLPPGPVSASSSVIIGMDQAFGKQPSDSDVKLVPDHSKGARPSDSDVQLAPKTPDDSDVTLIAKDMVDHGPLTPSPDASGDTAIRSSPVAQSKSKPKPKAVAPVDDDSDFELAPSHGHTPESGSDFELSAMDEPGDEFESTPIAGPSDSDVTAADPGFSGINLSRPSDSGINLQAASGFNVGDSIVLAPLSGDEIKAARPPSPSAAPGKPKPALSKTPPMSSPASKSKPKPKGKADKDIFDDTDFEVDAFDSGEADDQTMQLEAASDFELESDSDSDTGSEVFAIDEEGVDQNAATAMGPASLGEDEEDEEIDPFEAASGEMASSWDVESEGGSERAAPAAVLAPSSASAEWGGLWVGFLAVATVFMLFLAFVTMDLVRNLYEFQGNGPASGLVKSIAGLLPS